MLVSEIDDLTIYLEEAADACKKLSITLKDGTKEEGYPTSFIYVDEAEFDFSDGKDSGFVLALDDIEALEEVNA